MLEVDHGHELSKEEMEAWKKEIKTYIDHSTESVDAPEKPKKVTLTELTKAHNLLLHTDERKKQNRLALHPSFQEGSMPPLTFLHVDGKGEYTDNVHYTVNVGDYKLKQHTQIGNFVKGQRPWGRTASKLKVEGKKRGTRDIEYF
jgi:hypothetical protein